MNVRSRVIHHYIEKRILSRYEQYDAAHRLSHINMVINRSREISKGMEIDPLMVYVIAAYHDVGICEGRENHHISSGRILSEDRVIRFWFSRQEIKIMREAIEDHRASSKYEPRSIYGKIVAEADRQIDINTIIIRTLQYGFANNPDLSKEEHVRRAGQHLKEKYGEGGYLKLWLPNTTNAQKLEQLRALIKDALLLDTTINHLFNTALDQKANKERRNRPST